MMHRIFRSAPAMVMAAALITGALPTAIMAQEGTPHTIEALQAVSASLQANLKAGVEAYQNKDYVAACTSLALAVGDSRTMQWHNQGLINQHKALNQDTSELEAQTKELDVVIDRLEARTKIVCAQAQ
ncbi:MAG: hypothetical protein QM645_07265 [Asticcacaulis sp.]